MKKSIIYGMLLALMISIVPINIVYASEVVEEDTIINDTITVGGVSMTTAEYEDFKLRLDSCNTKEDIYSLYQSMGMDTSSLDQAFNESSETSDSELEGKEDDAENNVNNSDATVTDNDEEESIGSDEATVEPREENTESEIQNESAGEFSYEYDNSEGTTTLKAVAGVIGAISAGLVGYIVVMRKKKAKK